MRHIILKGQEHKLYISDISDKDAFMYPSYQQAKKALEEIIAHAEDFDEKKLCRELYSYSQNIIAFTAGRGEGKTSAMISFSTALQNGAISKEIGNYAFEVMPPIDPTIMERKQNILHLILSRMYRLAEDRWNGTCVQNGFSYSGPSESQKNELLCKFQKCLRAIDAIKCSKHDEHALIGLSLVSDSSVLKQDFYELTNDLLSFGSSNKGKKFLVIQLDDTDFQFEKAYQIMEDIRKFLSIPNVIILMATDMSMLRKVVSNRFIDETRYEEAEKLANKYIDKIIPPFHAIHLPKLDESIMHYHDARICYQDKEGTNVLLDSQSDDETLYSAQELLLRYVYRKTGIIFIAPKANYHNILPTTLRGMVQLLSLLSTMEDVPEITEDECKNGQKLRDAMFKRAGILETNILRFEKYFFNEWAYAKFEHEFVDQLHMLANAAPYERVSVAVSILTSLGMPLPKSTINFNDFAGVEEYFAQIVEDRPNLTRRIFALQTCFTLLHHKALVEQTKRATAVYDDGLFAIDCSSIMNYLPTSYRIPEECNDGALPVISKYKYSHKAMEIVDLTTRCLVQKMHFYDKTESGMYVMHLLNVVLAIGRYIQLNEFAKSNMAIQLWIFQVQCVALTVIPNWEVRNYIFDELEKTGRVFDSKRGDKLIQTWYEILVKTEDAVRKINASKDSAAPMVSCDFVDLMKIIENAEYKIGAVEKFYHDYRAKYDQTFINNIIISEFVPYYSKYLNMRLRFNAEKTNDLTQEVQRSYVDGLTLLAKECDEMISLNGFKANGTYFIDIFNEIAFAQSIDTIEHLFERFKRKFRELCKSMGIPFSKLHQEARSRIVKR